MAQDPFTLAERDIRAMVSAPWWPSTPPPQRQYALAGRMLALPDGTWWLFGAWARWYRWYPADGRWHLCPPPRAAATRMSARPAYPGTPVPGIPPQLIPTGPDFAHDPPAPYTFVGQGIPDGVTAGVRATIESAAALPGHDYPHWWERTFSVATPSTVVVAWGVMLWCAAVPAFAPQFDDQLLGLWSPYRSKPLPATAGPRWLTPPPLEALIGLYAERLRSGRVDAGVVILRTMWAVASALREDPRFRPRADALLAVLGTTLHNPAADYGALPYGDQALVRQWLTRCPPHLTPAIRGEISAGEHFRHACYDLAEVLTQVVGEPADRSYIEPRLLAVALLAADLAVVRREVARHVMAWIDPELRYAAEALLSEPDHPMRQFWPSGGRLPGFLRARVSAAEPGVRDALLTAMYAADLAWCRLAGIPARPRGFPAAVAIVAEIAGPAQAVSSPSSPASSSSSAGPETGQPRSPAADFADSPVDEDPSRGAEGALPPPGWMTAGSESLRLPIEDAVPSPEPAVPVLDLPAGVDSGMSAPLPSPSAPPWPPAEASGPEESGPEESGPEEPGPEQPEGTSPSKIMDDADSSETALDPDATVEDLEDLTDDAAMPNRPAGEIVPSAGERVRSDVPPFGVPALGDIDGYLRELTDMIGLAEVKRTVESLVTEARLAAERAAQRLQGGNPSRHLILLGRPGTGKATVTRLVGGIYSTLGLLDSGHVVTCRPGELVASDDAETEAKVAAVVDRAMGGVLMIEDAGKLDRTPIVVAELLRLMAARRDKFMVVCTSRPRETDGFLLANPGFRAEFGAIIDFPDPTDRELMQLFQRFAEGERYLLDEELRVELLGQFGTLRESPDFAFGDTVRETFERIVAQQAIRLAGVDRIGTTIARLSIRDLRESGL